MRNGEAPTSSGVAKRNRAWHSSLVLRIALEWRVLPSSRADGRPCNTKNGHVLHRPPILLTGSCVTIIPQTRLAALLPSLSVGARRNQQAELNPSQKTRTMNRMEQALLRYRHFAHPLEIASTTHHWSGNLVNGEREQV